MKRLSPVVICGVLRLGGRLVVSDLPLETRFPILLPNRSHVTFLIVNHYHIKKGHAGVMHTLASVCERFWVLKGMSCVRRVIKECRVCRIAFAKLESQVMSPLPRYRVALGRPAFTCVGVDFSGGFITKNGRKHTKRYLCVFTCMAVRAVHLELFLV